MRKEAWRWLCRELLSFRYGRPFSLRVTWRTGAARLNRNWVAGRVIANSNYGALPQTRLTRLKKAKRLEREKARIAPLPRAPWVASYNREIVKKRFDRVYSLESTIVRSALENAHKHAQTALNGHWSHSEHYAAMPLTREEERAYRASYRRRTERLERVYTKTVWFEREKPIDPNELKKLHDEH